MLVAEMVMSSNLQTRLVMVSATTSRRTGEMEVASSVGLPQPEAGAWRIEYRIIAGLKWLPQ